MMKKVTLLVIALLFVSGSVSGQALSLYADADRTTWELSGLPQYSLVSMYLFVAPTEDGVKCVELNVSALCGAYMPFVPVYNPDVRDPIMGTIPGDLACCLQSCHLDWVWICNVTILLQATPLNFWVQPFQGPPVQPFPKIVTCLDDEIEAYIWRPLIINGYCETAVEESSWGAIKSMYE